jgi:hypothetical protein
MDETQATQVVDGLRAQGVDAHVAKAGVYRFGLRVVLGDGREAVWDADGTAALEAEVLMDGDLVGFVPEIPGSADFSSEQIIDAISRADYSQPIATERPSAPPAEPALPIEGGVFRRFLGGFRDRD